MRRARKDRPARPAQLDRQAPKGRSDPLALSDRRARKALPDLRVPSDQQEPKGRSDPRGRKGLRAPLARWWWWVIPMDKI